VMPWLTKSFFLYVSANQPRSSWNSFGSIRTTSGILSKGLNSNVTVGHCMGVLGDSAATASRYVRYSPVYFLARLLS